jgi:hypothetical protein
LLLLLLLLLLQLDELDGLSYDDLAAIAKLTADPYYQDVMTVRLLYSTACALHVNQHCMSAVWPGSRHLDVMTVRLRCITVCQTQMFAQASRIRTDERHACHYV